MKKAQPIKVDESCKEVIERGFYTGKASLVVEFKGNCEPKAFIGGTAVKPLSARGGYIYHIDYCADRDVSVVEYRFQNSFFKGHGETGENFRQKVLRRINKQKIKNYIATLDGNYDWIVIPKLKAHSR